MVFFRKRKLSPAEALEAALRDKQALHQLLARRLNTAEMFVTDRREASERLALDGASDQALGRAEASSRAAEDRARTLRAALTQLDTQIAGIEREMGLAVEGRYRDSVADSLEVMVAAIAKSAPDYDSAAQALIDAVTKSANALPEATALAADLEAMRREVAAAAALVCAELKSVIARTRSGEARIAFSAPTDPAAPLLVQIERASIPALPVDGELILPDADDGSPFDTMPIAANAASEPRPPVQTAA